MIDIATPRSLSKPRQPSPPALAAAPVAASASSPDHVATNPLALQAAVLGHAHCAAASTAFVTGLAAANHCSRVTLGFVHRGFARLAALSNGSAEPLLGEAFDPVVAAMDEAVEQCASVCAPMVGDARHGAAVVRLAHTRLVQRQGGAAATVPIVYLGEVVGAVTCEWAVVPADFGPRVAAIADAASFVGPLLHLMHRRELPWRERVAARLRRTRVRAMAPEALRWRLAAAAFGLAAVCLCAVPIGYRVGGQARIEGEQQRSIVAPADGYIKLVRARPGDRVRQGDVLLEMADQDLLLQARKWASEMNQQQSAYSTALAKADRSAMVIAMAKADEARAHLDLIDAERVRSRIVAPFDGLVLQGDLSQALGAPVERGKLLMQLAPGTAYRVIVEVDERDIADVRAGQHGTLSLSALPWDGLDLQVTRITPLAKALDGSNVFEVEASIANGAEHVRPGLEGVAKIEVGRRPFAWTALHRLAGWLRLTLWAWWP